MLSLELNDERVPAPMALNDYVGAYVGDLVVGGNGWRLGDCRGVSGWRA